MASLASLVVDVRKEMKPEEYRETTFEVDGWPVRLTSYRLGETYYCKADNVSPGGQIARTSGATREEAEQVALAKARERLAQTRRPRGLRIVN
jgi:hypothetical protein